MRMIYYDEWRPKLEEYINSILLHGFSDFPQKAYRGQACQVQRDLLHLTYEYYLKVEDVSKEWKKYMRSLLMIVGAD